MSPDFFFSREVGQCANQQGQQQQHQHPCVRPSQRAIYTTLMLSCGIVMNCTSKSRKEAKKEKSRVAWSLCRDFFPSTLDGVTSQSGSRPSVEDGGAPAPRVWGPFMTYLWTNGAITTCIPFHPPTCLLDRCRCVCVCPLLEWEERGPACCWQQSERVVTRVRYVQQLSYSRFDACPVLNR